MYDKTFIYVFWILVATAVISIIAFMAYWTKINHPERIFNRRDKIREGKYEGTVSGRR